MKSTIIIVSLLLASASALGQTQQQQLTRPPECGLRPLDYPDIPRGEDATADELRQAREDVRKHSEAVTAWLTCRDQRARFVYSWLTDEQRERWEGTNTTVHNDRVEYERDMNAQIRAFNARLRNSSE